MLITKELNLDRPLPYGNYPVVIRVSHLGKDRIVDTSVCCLRKHWDKYNKTINRRDVAYSIKNIQVDAVYRKVVGNIQDYIDKILAENLELLLNKYKGEISTKDPRTTLFSKKISEPLKPIYFADLIKSKIKSIDSLNTRRGYEGFLNYFQSNFGNGPELEHITPEFVNSFRSRLEEDYPVRSSMRLLHSSHLKAVINLGKETGMISPQFTPKLPSYSLFPADRDLSINELRLIHDIFLRNIEKDPSLAQSSTLALAIFILDIAFQGIAPSDLASLKVGDISFSKVNIETEDKALSSDSAPIQSDIVVIKTVRNKTRVPVSIATALPPIRTILTPLMEGKTDDDYLIPCFDKDRHYTPEQRQSRLANYFRKMMRALNKALADEGHNNIRENITYYYARHAYCNLVDSLDVPRHIIQYLIGHRVTVLERNYLRRITLAEQAAISIRLFRLLAPDIDP